MEHNLAVPWGDRSSPPQNPFVSFRSPQADDLLFTAGARIDLVCQVNLRAVGLRWTLHRNLFDTPFRSGRAEALPANRFAVAIDTAGLHPGFYDLRVEVDSGLVKDDRDALQGRPLRAVCTFGWKAVEMAISDTRPADFDAFWAKARAQIDAVPLAAIEEPVQAFAKAEIDAYNLASACLPADFDPEGHRCERVESGKVSFAGPDGGRVHGWLAKPEGTGPFPAMLILPGAGFAARPRPLEHARHGYLALDLQIHGQEVDLPAYPNLPGYYSGFVHEPIEGYYYYRVHQRCMQAITYLCSRKDVDPKRIVVVGGSQGGRLTVVMAGLDRRVRAVVPAIAHFANQPYLRWAARCNGMSELGGSPDPARKPQDGMDVAGGPPLANDAVERCLAYYDPMNCAPGITCPVMFNAGLIDPVSPPSGVFAVFNRIPGQAKSLVALDGMGHDWCAEFDRRAFRWLDGVLSGAAPVAAPAARPGTFRVACLGDSITGRSDLARFLKWSHVLELMLRARLPGVAVEVLNRGVAGDTTDGALKRLDADVLAPRPDVVVVLLGGNDAARPGNEASFRRNYAEILDRMRGNGSRVLAMQYHVLPNPEHPATAWSHLDRNNPVIAELATARGIPVLDLAAPMRAAAARVPLGELVSEQDGVHLSPRGELVIAEAVFGELVRLGWLPSR